MPKVFSEPLRIVAQIGGTKAGSTEEAEATAELESA